MLPTAPQYFCFVVLSFFLYWPLSGKSPKAGIALVCLANLYFLAQWGWISLSILPAASFCDFLIGRSLGSAKTHRKLLITCSVMLNTGLIVSSKYLPLLLGKAFTHWVMPLGLSFYAFQAMTYTIDLYRKEAKPAANYWVYLASVTFFPTMLAGPINQVAKLLPQWTPKATLTGEEGSRAFFLIGLGLAKKFLIADYLAKTLVNRVFDLPTLYSGGDVLVAVYAYAFQLYYDFSGYTDIALGTGLLLGIKLAINFNGPYQAENIANFWRRWHISLSNWLTNYLFHSLPGKRVKAMLYLNLVITMAIGGLWHGASWTFLIWGLLHGLGLAGYRGWVALRKNAKPSPLLISKIWRILLTFHFVTFAWIFFRAASLETALQILGQIASVKTYAFDNSSPAFLFVLGIAIIGHYVPKVWYEWSIVSFGRFPAPAQAFAMAALVLSIRYIAATGAAPFIYTRF